MIIGRAGIGECGKARIIIGAGGSSGV